jgi:hypothetical protein
MIQKIILIQIELQIIQLEEHKLYIFFYLILF